MAAKAAGMTEHFDAIVIGAGEAGALIASRAVGEGHRVAMIYREPYGSTCVNVGCVPSKFMLHRARVAHTVRTSARFHVRGSEPEIDLPAIVREKNELVQGHRDEGLTAARQAERLTLIEGEAQFTRRNQVTVRDRVLTAERIFIATGMRPAIPAIRGLEDVPYLTNETVMDLGETPEHLIVLGGGYIGCELGQAYRRFGSEVTIVHGHTLLCSGEEPDASMLLGRGLRRDGIVIRTDHRAVSVTRAAGGISVTVRDAADSESTMEGTHLLVATGRRANTDNLNLGAAGIAMREDGSIPVDSRMSTNVDGVWAVGDVNGEQPFTRVCQEEGKIAYANAFQHADVHIDRRSLGHAVFTDPELASVGMTERAAREEGHDVAVGLVTFDQVEKAELIGETTGLVKYVVERETRTLLGAHIVGPSAADLLYPASVVIRAGGTLDDLAKTVGIFPTLAEGVEGAARGLVRRLAPDQVTGPLVAGDVATPTNEAAAGVNFACPACAGEFDTRAALDPIQEATAMGGDFSCPACGADIEVRERLEEDRPDGQHGQDESDSGSCPNCGSLVSVQPKGKEETE